MAPPQEFHERRKDHALRALYNRVDALEKHGADQDTAIAVLEEKAVTKNLLMGGLFVLSVSVFGGAWAFKSGVEASTAKNTAALATQIAEQGKKLDRNIEAQSVVNIKTEAMYLNTIERRPREEVREAVLRSTPKKEK